MTLEEKILKELKRFSDEAQQPKDDSHTVASIQLKVFKKLCTLNDENIFLLFSYRSRKSST